MEKDWPRSIRRYWGKRAQSVLPALSGGSSSAPRNGRSMIQHIVSRLSSVRIHLVVGVLSLVLMVNGSLGHRCETPRPDDCVSGWAFTRDRKSGAEGESREIGGRRWS